MKVGLVARAEDRGLGNLTWEWFRHMEPDRTLLVLPDAVKKAGLVSHVDRYPGATPVHFAASSSSSDAVGVLNEPTCREWLDGLDVVYSAETFYDWRFCEWADELGVATVCHVMPEFARPEWMHQPTMWWAPTRYRLQFLPPEARVVPVPIPIDRWPLSTAHAWQRPTEQLRWLHVAGAQTLQDRNGTRILMRALQYVQRNHDVVVATQSHLPITHMPVARGVHLSTRANLRNYWDLYQDVDALVMPRRYAGLCLPVLEGMGAGLAVLMSDMPPQNEEWPVSTVPTHLGTPIRLAGGSIDTGDTDVYTLADRMDQWAADPQRVAEARLRSIDYAGSHGWPELKPTIVAELERAIEVGATATRS